MTLDNHIMGRSLTEYNWNIKYNFNWNTKQTFLTFFIAGKFMETFPKNHHAK